MVWGVQESDMMRDRFGVATTPSFLMFYEGRLVHASTMVSLLVGLPVRGSDGSA